MIERRVAVYTGPGIGDILWGARFAQVLLSFEIPDIEVWYYSQHAWAREFLSRAPFKTHRRLPGGAQYLYINPGGLRPREHVIQGYANRLRNQLPQVPKTFEFDPRPLYCGDSTFIAVERSDRVGVARTIEPHYKSWRHADEFVRIMRSRGANAQPAPRFESGEAAIRWVSTCKLFVGPETGLTQLAVALSVPTIMIIGGRFTIANMRCDGVRHVKDSSCEHAPCRCWHNYPPCMEGQTPSQFAKRGLACVTAVGPHVVADLTEESLSEIECSKT